MENLTLTQMNENEDNEIEIKKPFKFSKKDNKLLVGSIITLIVSVIIDIWLFVFVSFVLIFLLQIFGDSYDSGIQPPKKYGLGRVK